MPEEGKFADQLTGQYDDANDDDPMLPDFYTEYGVGHGKLVAIPETASLVIDGVGDLRSLNIRRAWWEQVFDPTVHERFPRLHLVNWFEWNKMQPEVGAAVDWTAVEDPVIRSEFTAALPDWYHYVQEPYTC
jgi:hypothetical protein